MSAILRLLQSFRQVCNTAKDEKGLSYTSIANDAFMTRGDFSDMRSLTPEMIQDGRGRLMRYGELLAVLDVIYGDNVSEYWQARLLFKELYTRAWEEAPRVVLQSKRNEQARITSSQLKAIPPHLLEQL